MMVVCDQDGKSKREDAGMRLNLGSNACFGYGGMELKIYERTIID